MICHVISGLQTGGAERMLARLLERSPNSQVVICIGADGPQGNAIRALGVPVHVLHHRLWCLMSLLWCLKPTAVVGWMYHGNLVATLMGWLWQVPVVWNVRHSVDDLRQEKLLLRWVIRIGGWLSSYPRKIVYNSSVAASQHRALGYYAERAEVLPNGIDTGFFHPTVGARELLCSELKLPLRAFIVGHMARYHPMKDHLGFLQAAAHMMSVAPDACFVMTGRGVDQHNLELLSSIERLGLGDRVYLLGERQDVATLLSGMDLFVLSSSWGEGFPNVLLEAMACGVPVVTTDVGDARFVVGTVGRVVQSGDPVALAAAMKDLYKQGIAGLHELGEAGRQRAVQMFEISQVAKHYFSTWEGI